MIRYAYVLVEVACPKCAGPVLRLTRAKVLQDGRIDMDGAEPLAPRECLTCYNREKIEEAREANKRWQQQRWVENAKRAGRP